MCNMSTQLPPSEIQGFGLNAGSPSELSLGSGEMAAFPDHVNIWLLLCIRAFVDAGNGF